VRNVLMLLPHRVVRGEVYRLLTAGWVHGGLSHLFFNMLALHFFAAQTMKIIGVTRFVILFVTGVIAAFIPSVALHYKDRGYASLGASGGVAAVMVAALVLHPKFAISLPFIASPVRAGMIALAYMGYSLVHSYSEGDGVNHNAHFSGAVYGAALAWVFEPARVERSFRGLF